MSALQVWGFRDDHDVEDAEEIENEGKAAFRAFTDAMLADVL